MCDSGPHVRRVGKARASFRRCAALLTTKTCGAGARLAIAGFPARALTGVLLALAVLAQAGPARACTLDGIASISMNGTTATLTTGTPAPAQASYWAPFTLLAAALGDRVRLAEDLGKVQRSLTAEQLRTPFRWLFDDGALSQGYAVTHRFRRLGWHRVTVEYYYPSRSQWLAFDSAQIDIVPASALLWTNLPYYVTSIASAVIVDVGRALVWGCLALVIVAMLLERRQRGRKRAVVRRALYDEEAAERDRRAEADDWPA
jgi:hypothetical protein